MERIVRIAGRGDGVSESGRHVPLTAPGDLVEGDALLAPGPHRVSPPCRHFPECGGCQLQHVDDDAFAIFLSDRIVAALAAQGVAAPKMRSAHLSPPRSRRRATLHAERRGRQLLLGFKAENSHRIIDMRECHILRPELFGLVAPLRNLLPRLLRDRSSATLRMTLADPGVDLAIEGVAADDLASSEALSDFAAAHLLARLTIDDGFGPQTRWEPEPLTITLGGIPVPLPPGSFLQATADGEAVLVAAVREGVGGARVVADLFSGLGTFALALEGKVLAVEGARDAALALKAAAGRAQRQVFVDHRDLFRRPLDAKDLARLEAVVLDPPRAGAREQVAQLAAAATPRIVYVSCNPSTFARDARTLADSGHRLEWIQPVGQFRWSTHVELVATFSRAP